MVLASAGTTDNKIYLWSIPVGAEQLGAAEVLSGHAAAVLYAKPLPDGTVLSVSADGQAMLWRLESRQWVHHSIGKVKANSSSISATGDGLTLAIVDGSHVTTYLRTVSGHFELLNESPITEQTPSMCRLLPAVSAARGVPILASAGPAGAFQLWQLKSEPVKTKGVDSFAPLLRDWLQRFISSLPADVTAAGAKPAAKPPTMDQKQAAVKLQSRYRGHKTRQNLEARGFRRRPEPPKSGSGDKQWTYKVPELLRLREAMFQAAPAIRAKVGAEHAVLSHGEFCKLAAPICRLTVHEVGRVLDSSPLLENDTISVNEYLKNLLPLYLITMPAASVAQLIQLHAAQIEASCKPFADPSADRFCRPLFEMLEIISAATKAPQVSVERYLRAAGWARATNVSARALIDDCRVLSLLEMHALVQLSSSVLQAARRVLWRNRDKLIAEIERLAPRAADAPKSSSMFTRLTSGSAAPSGAPSECLLSRAELLGAIQSLPERLSADQAHAVDVSLDALFGAAPAEPAPARDKPGTPTRRIDALRWARSLAMRSLKAAEPASTDVPPVLPAQLLANEARVTDALMREDPQLSGWLPWKKVVKAITSTLSHQAAPVRARAGDARQRIHGARMHSFTRART
jgi:hypothetical protein